jgi:calcium-translocating P-type ATPase
MRASGHTSWTRRAALHKMTAMTTSTRRGKHRPDSSATTKPEARAWHRSDPSEVAEALGTGTAGLTPAEAVARLARHGPNRLEEAPPRSDLAILLAQFKSPLIYILLAATLATLLLEEWVDAGVIAVVLILNAAIGFIQERSAERSVRALMKLVSPRARVVRGGQETEIESVDLVPGDLVLLESGVRVPADLRLSTTNALAIDESLLTGESVPVGKVPDAVGPEAVLADRKCMAYTGSVVTSGRGRGFVVATAGDTELGAIAAQVRGEAETETPLQRRMKRFAGVVGIAVAVSAVLALGLGLLLGESLRDMFMVAVALAVAAVPEGLPVVFTITLAIGVRRMAARGAIVRRLTAVETLGSTSVIGSDKTGTLTQNRMTVQRVWTPAGALDLSEDATVEAAAPGSAIHEALLAGASTNEATLEAPGSETLGQGDPTELALLVAARRAGLDLDAVRAEAIVAEIHFEPERGYSATWRRRADGSVRVYLKGAPERVLGMCDRMAGAEGAVPVDADAIHAAARELAAEGLRVLAMAVADVEAPPAEGALPETPSGLVFAGLQGMMDPPRHGVKEAVAGCLEAGIRVAMITGDHPITARAIGQQIGIADEDSRLLTGAEIEGMDDETLVASIEGVPIFARTSPSDKLRVVHAWQRSGEVVAVTGDGVNDAPALKAAEVGVAMGRSGTDVAREASDIVLTDDDFVSIQAAVEEGRVTFDNLRKVTFFLVSTGAAMILTILFSLTMGWAIPFLPAQILWLNLVTNGLQDVALAFEPKEKGIGQLPPRPPQEGIMSWVLWERTAVVAVVMTVGTLFMFMRTLDETGSMIQAQSVALTTMVLFQAFHVGNSRSEWDSIVKKSPFSNPFLFIATAAALLVHTAALNLGPLQFVLRVEPIPMRTIAVLVGVALTIVPVVELHKLIRSSRRPRAISKAPRTPSSSRQLDAALHGGPR